MKKFSPKIQKQNTHLPKTISAKNKLTVTLRYLAMGKTFSGLISTDTLRQMGVDSMSILRRYVKNKISTNFCLISTYFFDVIWTCEKSTIVLTYPLQRNFDR